jgi:hypothetical protein
MGLRELERRLKDEPDNLGLRVTVAGAMHDAGRKAEAVELYRSVAMAYRDQGRTQQAIAVCRSILEIAPDDAGCTALLAALTGGTKSLETGPVRRSSLDETPLPGPLPYHVADPTTRSLKKLSDIDLPVEPTHEGAKTRPGSEDSTRPVTGIANAARRISASLSASSDDGIYDIDMSSELDTRQRPRIESDELKKISRPPPTAPVQRVDFDDAPTRPPAARDLDALGDDGVPIPDTEEELTVPRELPDVAAGSGVRGRPGANEVTRVREPISNTSTAMLGALFFAPLPAQRRAAVLSRFHRRAVRGGETVIAQGTAEPSLIIVGRGRLEVRVERPDGKLVVVGSVGSGDYIGEAALLSRSPAAAHVIAATDAELLVLLPHDFYEIAGAFPALWAQLKDVAERRAREQQAKLR